MTTMPTAYPPAVTTTIASLRARTGSTLYAATVLRTAYPPGEMPADVAALYLACVRGKGVQEALAGMGVRT